MLKSDKGTLNRIFVSLPTPSFFASRVTRVQPDSNLRSFQPTEINDLEGLFRILVVYRHELVISLVYLVRLTK